MYAQGPCCKKLPGGENNVLKTSVFGMSRQEDGSLLIFYLEDQSIDECKMLKSPIIIVLVSISPFMVVSICLTH